MGTRGTIAVKADNKTIRVYNHFDSYPTELGRDFAAFIRNAPENIAEQIAAAQIVDESAEAPADALAALKVAGIWQNVSTGSDWYSALRNAQGDFAQYLALGYVPAWEHGDSEEWGYLADFDTQTLHITCGAEPVGSVTFASLADEDKTKALMKVYEEKGYDL